MILYDFRCKECQFVKEQLAAIDETELPCACGGTMERLITARYSVVSDLEPYMDYNIGTDPVYVKSKQHRARLMKENGVGEIYGKGWK